MVLETSSFYTEEDSMQLTEVTPSSLVAGFGCAITRQENCLVAGSDFETLFIDHYLTLVITNDGTNKKYPRPIKLSVLLSQYVEPCNVGVKITESDTPTIVVILQPNESLEGIKLAELAQEDTTSVVTIIWIKNTDTGIVTIQVWGMATVGHDAFQPIIHKRNGNRP